MRIFTIFLAFVLIGLSAGAQTGKRKGPARTAPKVSETRPVPEKSVAVSDLEPFVLVPEAKAEVAPVQVSGSSEKIKSASETAQAYGYSYPPAPSVASGPGSALRQTQPQGQPPARYIAERGAMKRQYDRPQEMVGPQELRVETSRADDDYRWFREENRHQERGVEASIDARRDQYRHREEMTDTFVDLGRDVMRNQSRGGGSSSRPYQQVEWEGRKLPGGEVIGGISGIFRD